MTVINRLAQSPVNKLLLAFVALLASPLCAADWEIVPDSSTLSFVSTKNVDVAEAHRFTTVSGGLTSSDGSFVLEIDLKSLETGVPIRNDRIHEHLLQHSESAKVLGKVDLAMLGDIGVGETQQAELSAQLMLLDNSTPLLAKVQIAASQDRLKVVSAQPILLNMRLLGLGNGIETLREIAGLTSISMAVPVYFDLTLKKMP